jgi:hypothetical protein
MSEHDGPQAGSHDHHLPRALRARNRQSCKHWKHVEMMMVWWSRPHKLWLCDLTDATDPKCESCDRWEYDPLKWSEE